MRHARNAQRKRGAVVPAMAFLGALIAGCAGPATQLPDERYYRLPEPTARTAAPAASIIVVALPRTDGLHAERALLYSRHDRPLEILRHHYYFWAESPPRLLQDHLIEYLRQAQIAQRVEGIDGAPVAAPLLESRLLRFERQVGGPNPGVLVELELGWRRPAADGGGSRRNYRVYMPAANDTVYASVQAFGQALTEIYERFLHDFPPP